VSLLVTNRLDAQVGELTAELEIDWPGSHVRRMQARLAQWRALARTGPGA
jgi:hypothetical protein